MNSFPYFLLTLALSLSGQALLKRGVTEVLHGGRPSLPEFVRHLPSLALSPAVLGGLCLSGLGVVAWMFVLSRYELSRALPILGGLGYLVLFGVGRLVLEERAGWHTLVGIVLVTAGLYFLTLKPTP